MAALSRGLLGRTTVDGSGQPDVTITAGTPSLLRAINERSVLDLIHRRGPLSRAQVARVSGLSKPTVSLALSGLLESAQDNDFPAALRYGLNSCIECGICSYVCPSRLPLLPAIREMRHALDRKMASAAPSPAVQNRREG